MPLNAGDRLGAYEIIAELGAGGMGVVYRARDTKLNRDVALKVLPDLFADDPERLARFQREAQVLASLNHPNIGAIYGLEEADGVRALVLELVEGPTLADRIAQAPLPLEAALPIARQMAEALGAAHERSIMHRDLKPANVKVTPDGTVKVLDFGLAKALEGEAGGDPSLSPTLTATATRAGTLMGTAAYMSPEQANGQSVDKRADIWAFGCVLYEMLTARQAFAGQTVTQVLARILEREPDLTLLPANTYPKVRELLRHCLQKDPKRRLRDIGDALIEIDEASAAPAAEPSLTAPGVPQPVSWWWAMPSVLAGVVSGGIIVGLAVWSLMRPGPESVARFPIPLAPDEAFNFSGRHLVAVSPDGSHVVYQANEGLYLRPLDQLQAAFIPGTEDGGGRSPFFSPDGQWIGFYAGGQLKRVSVSGGAPVRLCDAQNPWGASWGPDDTIVFGQGPQGIWQVPGTGGTPGALIPVEEGEQAHGPQLLPGAEWVLFTLRPSGAASWDEAQIVVQSLETGERTVLIDGGRDARYVPTGHLVYALTGVLLAVPFDLGERRVTGGPVPLVEGVSVAGGQTGAAHFSLASDGSLVYVPGFAGGGAARTLVWVDRQGREEPAAAPTRAYVYPRISPDGTRVAVDVRDEESDIWIWDVARETLSRLTFDPGLDYYPVWAADGRRVLFSSSREGAPNLFWKAADGTGSVERLTESPNVQSSYSFSPDGTLLVFREDHPETGNDLGVLSMEGDRASDPLLATEFGERNAEVSPDGRWIAYQSDASGSNEIYVRPFPTVDEGRWQISTGGGIHPLWAPDGRELFYLSSSGLMAVAIRTDPTFTAGNPEVLFEGQYYTGPGRTHDISPDGQRFLFVKGGAGQTSEDAGRPQLIFVANWFEELKQRVPTP